jgi:hypothetical protein
MEIIIPRCAGLDVHQKTVMACVRLQGPSGRVTQEIRTFGTTTRALEQLRAWLQACAVSHVAMEATGVLWKPVWHVLDGGFEQMLLVNPRDLKRVPGRKTDVKDAAWIAQLLQCGLLRGSFVPPRPIRDLRDLTRARATLEQERTAVTNRIHKLLEDATIKLGSVASEILGVSGRARLGAMVKGELRARASALFVRDGLLVAQPFDESRLELTGTTTRVGSDAIEYVDVLAAVAASASGTLVYKLTAAGASRNLPVRRVTFIRTGGRPMGASWSPRESQTTPPTSSGLPRSRAGSSRTFRRRPVRRGSPLQSLPTGGGWHTPTIRQAGRRSGCGRSREAERRSEYRPTAGTSQCGRATAGSSTISKTHER